MTIQNILNSAAFGAIFGVAWFIGKGVVQAAWHQLLPRLRKREWLTEALTYAAVGLSCPEDGCDWTMGWMRNRLASPVTIVRRKAGWRLTEGDTEALRFELEKHMASAHGEKLS